MEETGRIRKKIREQAEKNMEIDNSDIPVHEKFAKEEHIKKLKKRSI
ncbi:hypothetical protein KY366_02400 [Candidatus Woesearchaeota archaeon]|nr:hypothetical protein [Candidatus Woesearchaeota archaeon]